MLTYTNHLSKIDKRGIREMLRLPLDKKYFFLIQVSGRFGCFLRAHRKSLWYSHASHHLNGSLLHYGSI